MLTLLLILIYSQSPLALEPQTSPLDPKVPIGLLSLILILMNSQGPLVPKGLSKLIDPYTPHVFSKLIGP